MAPNNGVLRQGLVEIALAIFLLYIAIKYIFPALSDIATIIVIFVTWLILNDMWKFLYPFDKDI